MRQLRFQSLHLHSHLHSALFFIRYTTFSGFRVTFNNRVQHDESPPAETDPEIKSELV